MADNNKKTEFIRKVTPPPHHVGRAPRRTNISDFSFKVFVSAGQRSSDFPMCRSHVSTFKVKRIKTNRQRTSVLKKKKHESTVFFFFKAPDTTFKIIKREKEMKKKAYYKDFPSLPQPRFFPRSRHKRHKKKMEKFKLKLKSSLERSHFLIRSQRTAKILCFSLHLLQITEYTSIYILDIYTRIYTSQTAKACVHKKTGYNMVWKRPKKSATTAFLHSQK